MFVLKREPGGMVEYMTLNKDYVTGVAFGAWCPDAKVAFGFARQSDAEEFMAKFKHFCPNGVAVGEISG